MKIISFYLPQFHEIEENNKWWGKGFTEWTNVKKGKKLFKTHYQPFIPLNNNYYNLLDKETVKWQTELANNYGIYGFCYYHYWFEGKKLLEKPAENLLKWKDINQKFCFCWANHSWKKTWNGLNEVLINQTYGDEDKWNEHFNYLLPFFKDERYIKIDNKPVFMIFKPEDIKNLDKMLEIFNKKCQEEGFEGIYIIESKGSLKKMELFSKKSCASIIREPDCSKSKSPLYEKIISKLKCIFKKNYLYYVQRYKYYKFINYSLEISKKYTRSVVFPGIFVSWDNTVRHGRRGYVIEGSTPQLFKKYLLEQKKIMKEKNSEYIFLNAWNEWAEGMYLEPDEKNKYGYLEAIKEVIETQI